MNDYNWILEMQKRKKEYEKRKREIIDLDLLDLWLDKELYIRPKYKRNEIIQLYKKSLREDKDISYLERKLDELGWYEITYSKIIKYILYPEYRFKENKKLEF